MNTKILAGIAALALGVAGVAQAGEHHHDRRDFRGPPAKVVYVQPRVVYAQPRVVHAPPRVVYVREGYRRDRGNDQTGAIIGGAIGALIGSNVARDGNQPAGAAIGAAVGVIIGNEIAGGNKYRY